MFANEADCINQTKAACLVIQQAYAWVASQPLAPDLSASHAKSTKAAELAEQAMGLPTGTFSNPDGGGTGKSA